MCIRSLQARIPLGSTQETRAMIEGSIFLHAQISGRKLEKFDLLIVFIVNLEKRDFLVPCSHSNVI